MISLLSDFMKHTENTQNLHPFLNPNGNNIQRIFTLHKFFLTLFFSQLEQINWSIFNYCISSNSYSDSITIDGYSFNDRLMFWSQKVFTWKFQFSTESTIFTTIAKNDFCCRKIEICISCQIIKMRITSHMRQKWHIKFFQIRSVSTDVSTWALLIQRCYYILEKMNLRCFGINHQPT